MGIAIVAIVVLCFVGICLVVDVQSMSDEDREKFGHGPKGQGR